MMKSWKQFSQPALYRKTWSIRKIQYLSVIVFLGICACQNAQTNTPATESTISAIIPTSTVVVPTALETSIPITVTPQPEVTTFSPVCSPLEGFSLETLQEIKTNPVITPRVGEDLGHHGIDYSFWSYGEWDTIEGLGVNSVLNGTIAGVVYNRFPYGYMVMVETPLDQLQPELRTSMESLPQQPIADLTQSSLTCPVIPVLSNESPRSLYLVYAHLLNPVTINPGDQVTCSGNLGKVGNSGDSSNAHLHFETRIGPSGFQFDEMAHYLNDSSEMERYNYCIWRISGIYQLVDPEIILKSGQP